MTAWIRSQHLAWFGRAGTAYCYHNTFGYLLEMSPDLKLLIDFFAEQRADEDAVEQFRGQWSRDQIGQFIGVFVQQRVLVQPLTDELAELAAMVPIKGPWILAARADNGRITAVTSRGFGHEAYAQPQLLQLDDWHSELWRRIDGERNIKEHAAVLSEAYDGDDAEDLQRAIVAVAAWTHSDRQLTRTLPGPRSTMARLPPYATSTMPFAPLGESAARDAGASLDLTAYHQHHISDAEAQFEEAETTLSHLFSDPHPALGDRSFGQRFAEIVVDRGWVTPQRHVVLEVGGGTGRFAEAAAQQMKLTTPPLQYTIVELSPVLHQAQAARLAHLADCVATQIGTAEKLDFGNESVDFVVSNEVIADLRVGMVTRASLNTLRPDGDTDAEGLDIALQYGLTVAGAPEPIPVQVGATRFVEELARVLRPGGTAVLTEFGGENQFPLESTHLDHAEWSIHFGHLMQVARHLGLQASLTGLPHWIGLRPDVWVLASNRTQFRNLRFLARTVGCDLRKRALTPEQLAVALGGRLRPDRLEGLQFRPAGERVMGLVPDEFKVLVLTKPAAEKQ